MTDETRRGRCRRRDFLKAAGGAAGSALALSSCGGDGAVSDWQAPVDSSPIASPRIGLANPYLTADGRPLLVSVEGSDFAAMLRRGLQALGELQRLVPTNQNVLVKANFNSAEDYPATSHPSHIASLVSELRAVTTGVVSVGDEGFDPGPAVYSYLDLQPTIEAVGGVVTTFSDTYRVRRQGWDASRPDFHVFAAVHDAPVLVNLCNLKRHHTAHYTCAIKNNVGTVAGSGGGQTRAYLHGESQDFFGDLAEIAACVNPDLHVVDALSVLSQGGPFLADGVPVAGNRLIISGDMVATDAYCVRLLDEVDPSFRTSGGDRQTGPAAGLGLGERDLNTVEVLEVTA